jgi:hypothetical protein
MNSYFRNPVIIKELKERFRTPKTVWILALYLLVMGAVLFGFIYLAHYRRIYFRPGDSFFWAFYEMMKWENHQSAVFQFMFSMNPGFVLGEILGEHVAPVITYYFVPWKFYSVFYLILSVLSLWLSTYLVNPQRRN